MTLIRLSNPTRQYAWGSRSFLAGLRDAAPTKHPEAELWIGAHPRAPSRLLLGTGDKQSSVALDEWIASDPVGVLGDPRLHDLPFLLKVLAADLPLSVQVHPDAAAAHRGFAEESRSGTPRDSPRRSFADPNPKSEILLALTPFFALSGFRPTAEIATNLSWSPEPSASPGVLAAGFPLPEGTMRDAVNALRTADGHTEGAALRGLLRSLVELSKNERAALLATLDRELERRSSRSTKDPWTWVARCRQCFPDDALVLAPLILNLVELEPGEVLFTQAGVLHSYLQGAGVELMTPSDNVARAGLTEKPINVNLLCQLTTFVSRPAQRLAAETGWAGSFSRTSGTEPPNVYTTPAEELQLEVWELNPASPAIELPALPRAEILLCLRGAVSLEEVQVSSAPKGTSQGSSPGVLALGPTESAFRPAGSGLCRVSGIGTLVRAGAPKPRS